MISISPAEKELRALACTGLLHPRKPAAAEIRAAFDSLGRNGVSRHALLMASAHLLGCWIPLLKHGPSQLPPDSSILALAATERESGSDLHAVRCTGEQEARGWRLDGEKIFVTNGPIATHFLVIARTARASGAKSLSCFLVGRDQPGLESAPMPPLMGLREASIGTLRLEGALVPPSAMIGSPGEGATIFRTAMCWERSLILASAPGFLERLLELVLADASRKLRMGMPLCEQPGFQGKIDEVRGAIRNLRELGDAAARVLHSGQNAVLSAMQTKLSCSRLYESASRALLQLGGAHAYLSGSELESNFRDSLASSIYSGPNDLLETVLKKTANGEGKV